MLGQHEILPAVRATEGYARRCWRDADDPCNAQILYAVAVAIDGRAYGTVRLLDRMTEAQAAAIIRAYDRTFSDLASDGRDYDHPLAPLDLPAARSLARGAA